MLILGIETSCDETSVALVENGERIAGKPRYTSQMDVHADFGGVVPELACRRHVEVTQPASEKSAGESVNLTWKDIDAVAVTNGPGSGRCGPDWRCCCQGAVLFSENPVGWCQPP
jgi:N6-L-threonylcarbamoyladenine synthase